MDTPWLTGRAQAAPGKNAQETRKNTPDKAINYYSLWQLGLAELHYRAGSDPERAD